MTHRRLREPEQRKRLWMRIGAACREARHRLGLTQDAVAMSLDISGEFYAKIERGKAGPQVLTLSAIHKVLKIDLNMVLSDEEPAPIPRPAPAPKSPLSELPKDVQLLIVRAMRVPHRSRRFASLLLKELAKRDSPQR